ncbi:MAG: methionine adenosyltransferase [Oscillospiraceae bacterium]|nr:methionine adenosyltransferase [Oscillospiraceae bacterium]
MGRTFFTSESVTEGHPDKLCDQISDAVLDAYLEQDKLSRVACETICTTGMVLCMGEITSTAQVDIARIAREVIVGAGYSSERLGFDGHTCAVLQNLDEQSGDISMGVSEAFESKNGDEDERAAIGAGDQGMMFGYACDETDELMPLTASIAHKLSKRLAQVRKEGILPYLRPDGKTQVTAEFENGEPVRVDTIVVSTQHEPEIELEQIREDIIEHVIKPIVPAELLDEGTTIFVNPTGRFVIGGPQGDSGLTGRKIIVDTYGGYARHGGGAFSGKDPTKVDRSAAYAARYAAKNVVASGFARKCEIQLAYAIGVAQPVSVHVNTFGTGKVSDDILEEAVKKVFDFRPASIIEDLKLREVKYRPLAAYGHMGREELDIPWEKTDRGAALKEAVNSVIA